MSTLLLRLAAPLQAWGTDSKFDIRKTEHEPSKSGVIGLLAAALGRRRDESLEDLAGLEIGVRADREGKMLHDFHMAKNAKTSYVTHRYYLEDAVFLVAVSSDNEQLLKTIEYALHHPAFPLFLGRRSCPPTLPISLGIREMGLEDALRTEPLLVDEKSTRPVRIVLDALETGYAGSRVRDIPISFHPEKRVYTWRRIETRSMYMATGVDTEHDPMQELR